MGFHHNIDGAWSEKKTEHRLHEPTQPVIQLDKPSLDESFSEEEIDNIKNMPKKCGQLCLSCVLWVIMMNYIFQLLDINLWKEMWATLACGSHE